MTDGGPRLDEHGQLPDGEGYPGTSAADGAQSAAQDAHEHPTAPAEMGEAMQSLYQSLSQMAASEPDSKWAAVRDRMDALWCNPEDFAEGDLAHTWKESEVLTVFELGVNFGIEYEEAYPTGRRDEWPVPPSERPSADQAEQEESDS